MLDKLPTSPVSSLEAKEPFINAMIKVCEINGVDTINGFGTTENCLNTFEILISDHCFSQLSSFDNKTYTSKKELKDDFSAYLGC